MKHAGQILLIAILSVPAGWAAAPADDEFHECRDANGNVIYQDDPCTDPRAKPTGARDPDVSPPPPRDSPPPAKPAPAAAGHRRNSTTQARTASVPPIREPRVPPRRKPERFVGPVDPRFVSPAETWQTFVNAMRNGDRSTALACLTSTALEEFGPHIESLTPEKLRETVLAFARIEIEGDVGPFWSIRVLRANERPKWIFLERTDKGEWKIAAI